MNDITNYSPDNKFIVGSNLNRFIFIVGWHQPDAIVFYLNKLQRELTIDIAYSHQTMCRIHILIDYKQIAIMNIRIDHAVTIYPGKESRCRMLDQLLIQVNDFLHIVLSRTRKPCTNASIGKRQRQFGFCLRFDNCQKRFIHTTKIIKNSVSEYINS